MGLYVSVVAAIIFCCYMHTSKGDEATQATEATEAGNALEVTVQAVNSFSKALYKEVSSKPGNLIVSPFSVEAVAAMLYVGLRGDTAKNVAAALNLPDDRSLVQEGFKSLFGSLQSVENVTLEIANKIYIEKSFHVKDEYRVATETYFRTTAEEADIKNNAESVRINVNKWAAEKTHDKIQDLLPPGSLRPDVVMVLLNAIYFKGLWKNQFSKKLTFPREFYLSSGSSKPVPMMNIETPLPYAELYEQDLQVLKLPYQGDKFSMLILLPKKNNGLQELESNLQNLNVHKIMEGLREIDMTVALPRFKILSDIDLNEPLQNIGMGELFQRGANFSGISDGDVFISKALQKAFIEVNEEGTEAAAVTGFLFVAESYVPRPRGVFIADHPFMFMIVEEKKGSILFMGRVLDPQK